MILCYISFHKNYFSLEETKTTAASTDIISPPFFDGKYLVSKYPKCKYYIFLDRCFFYLQELQLQKSRTLTTLSWVHKEYSLSFDMIVTKHTSDEWRNVIHLTTGDDNGKLGNRIPGVWLFRDNKLHIRSAVGRDHDYEFTYRQPIIEGRWYRIEIQQVIRNGKVG